MHAISRCGLERHSMNKALSTAALAVAASPLSWPEASFDDSPERFNGASASAPGALPGRVELSIIIPTFNEAGHIGELLRRIAICLAGVKWEAIVVDDDSADGTAALVRSLGRADPRLVCLERIGRRGLSSACIEGIGMASGRFVAIIDADLQHDEALLPSMLRTISDGPFDLVVGSRYMAGGGIDSWSFARRSLSRLATHITHRVLKIGLSDPMSGFFMLRPQIVRDSSARLSGTGFKLLLDLVASSPAALRIAELPYRFSPRQRGQSKLDSGVAWAFLLLLVKKAFERMRRRFGLFCVVGSSGVVVQLGVLWTVQGLFGASFPAAQTVGVLASMVSNFTLNNALTFRDARLRGGRFMVGLSQFAGLCAVGAVINVVIASALERSTGSRLMSVVTGIIVGAACNYVTTSLIVWRRTAREAF
jgi:dolichol-phosphate mannosyltransferase